MPGRQPEDQPWIRDMAAHTAHGWLIEPLENLPGALTKRMFGCDALYLEGKLVVVLADDEEPWNGLLLPVERPCQASVLAEFPQLHPHPVLGKWLYLPAARDDFEPLARTLLEGVRRRDPRFGTLPRPRAPRRGRKGPTAAAPAPPNAPRADPDGRPPHLR